MHKTATSRQANVHTQNVVDNGDNYIRCREMMLQTDSLKTLNVHIKSPHSCSHGADNDIKTRSQWHVHTHRQTDRSKTRCLWRPTGWAARRNNIDEYWMNIQHAFSPSVLGRCWLGGTKGIRSVKKLSGGVLAWLSVCSEVQTCTWPSWRHCHSLSLASVKSRLVLPFWYWLTRVVPEKGR